MVDVFLILQAWTFNKNGGSMYTCKFFSFIGICDCVTIIVIVSIATIQPERDISCGSMHMWVDHLSVFVIVDLLFVTVRDVNIKRKWGILVDQCELIICQCYWLYACYSLLQMWTFYNCRIFSWVIVCLWFYLAFVVNQRKVLFELMKYSLKHVSNLGYCKYFIICLLFTSRTIDNISWNLPWTCQSFWDGSNTMVSHLYYYH